MRNLRRLLTIILISGLMSSMVVASIDVYPFKDVAKEKQFNDLLKVLRCPKCQNSNIADSTASLAKDIKKIIYNKIRAGETDTQIIKFLKDRYGNFISYDPPLNAKTMVIWYGPFIALVLGAFGIFIYTRKHHLKERDAALKISASSQATLAQWSAEEDTD